MSAAKTEDECRRAGAIKRGGRISFITFDATKAEGGYSLEPVDLDSLDRL
ncbi:MAG: hypothetical protein WCF18_05765 [Chthoniobacteraceae bacterium]